MVETFTPAVCGSRSRQRTALLLFGLGALAASAALGAALGLLGGLMGTRPALIAAAALAALAAVRELGLVRLPLPQSRRQVPERWRSELPLPVWSAGYGAGLGAGFLTFQPVATFWVACVAALALGRPLVAAGCFALYGAGRAFMAFWPRRNEPDGAAAVERMVGQTSLMARANVAVLLLAVVLLAVAPAAGAAVTAVGAGFDPSADGATLARARMGSGRIEVVVKPPAPNPAVPISPADAPALDGDRLAYVDSHGIKVIDWKTNEVLAKVDGNVSDPALDWPLLAYRLQDAGRERLILADFSRGGNPTTRRAASVPSEDSLGRPSLGGGRLAWGRVQHRSSAIWVLDLDSWTRRTIVRTRVGMESNPSVTATRIVWVEQRPHGSLRGEDYVTKVGSYLRMRRFGHGGTKTLMHLSGRKRLLWTTALTGRTAYVTRWAPKGRRSALLRVTF
ncbi:MAG TPA: hypothetical protein VH281_00450 [Gaiellaceae bacterium]|jgi:hypothetical protein